MKTIKKSLSLLLSAVMILSMFTGMNISTSATNMDYVNYKIIDSKVTITGCTYGIKGELVIPNTIEGYPVTEIGNYAFSEGDSLTNITIPDSVTKIGFSAFFECESLTSVTIPAGVTEIGEHAFQECGLVTNIIIPKGVTEISDYTFSWCSALESITIPDSVTKIGDFAFCFCISLTNIAIPNSVTEIGRYAFSECDSLTNIAIPNSVTEIGRNAFSECESLTSITIPVGVTSIGDSAFYDCKSITDVYYSGTEAQWNNILIGSDNDCLTSATIHFNAVPPDTSDVNKTPVFTDSRIIVKNGCVLVPPMSKTELDAVSSETYKINDSKGSPKTDGALVAGDTLICSGNSYKILVLFDADGNGKITSADARIILRCTLRLENISDDIRFAVTADETRKPTSSDARKALRVALRLDTI